MKTDDVFRWKYSRRQFLKIAGGAVGVAAMGSLPGCLGGTEVGREAQVTEREVAAGDVIKVGVLYSLTGTTSVLEHSLADATAMAIDEINAAGGVKGRKLVPVVEDYNSNPAFAAEKAKKLTLQDQVVATFGMYTTASRQAVRPVFERNEGVLLYPTMYEGQECSPAIFYTGAVPNQQLYPYIPWVLDNIGPNGYLIGADYKFPVDSNTIIKAIMAEKGGKVVGEEYVPLGESEFSSSLGRIRRADPDWIFSDLVGDHIIAFYRQYADAGFKPDKIPIVTHTTTEEENRAMGGKYAAGHNYSWNYFQLVDTPENRKFVPNYLNRYGKDRVTHAIMEAAYFQVYILKQALESTDDWSFNGLRKAISGQELKAPQGDIKIDPDNQHTYLRIRFGWAREDGLIEPYLETKDRVKPEVYSHYLVNKACKRPEGGLQGVIDGTENVVIPPLVKVTSKLDITR